MKKISILILAFFAMLNISNAQFSWPCDPCPAEEITLLPEQSYTYPGTTCVIHVRYQKKVCADGQCYLNMVYFSKYSGDCSRISDIDLFDYANKQMIADGYMSNCVPGHEGYQTVIRVYETACYKWEGQLGPDGNHHATLVSCNESSCCQQIYWAELVGTTLNVYGGILNTVRRCLGEGTFPPQGCIILCNP